MKLVFTHSYMQLKTRSKLGEQLAINEVGGCSVSFLVLSLVQSGDMGAEKVLTPGSSQFMQ